MDLMLRVYRRLVAAGDRSLADELASVILSPLRDELRAVDRRSDKAGWARQNERIADMMVELGRYLIAQDNMRHAYDAWVDLDDRQSACRCALKLAHIAYYADQENDAVSWTDKVIESGAEYSITAEAYRLQVKALRSLDRFGAARILLSTTLSILRSILVVLVQSLRPTGSCRLPCSLTQRIMNHASGP